MIQKNKWAIITFILSTTLCFYAWQSWIIRFSLSDAVAQFFPITLQGYRSIKEGNLPLYNFYQYLGHPLMQLGYFPVLYPITWLTFAISEFILKDFQQSWNLLCFFQLVINASCSYYFFRHFLRVSEIFSCIGSLSIGFLGIIIFLGDWFYIISLGGFIPLCLTFAKQSFEQKNIVYSIFLAVSFALFFFCSNVQMFFYSMHFIALGLILIVIFTVRKHSFTFGELLRRSFYWFYAAILSVALLFPYLYSIVQYSQESIRKTMKVNIDQYYWTTNSLEHVIKYSWWPSPGKHEILHLTPFSFHIGFIPMLGIIVTPFVMVALAYRKQGNQVLLGLFLVLTTLFGLLMSLGEPGVIAGWLYKVPVYNWFRHSIKWTPFFQIFSVFLGIFALDALFKLIFSKKTKIKYYRLAEFILLAVVVIFLIRFIQIAENPKRLTDVELPLPAPSIANHKNYRHVGLWHMGDSYKTVIPAQILGHNYATVWELPAIAGYEPMMRQKNYDNVQGNWFPGYYMDASTFDLKLMHTWNVRYIRVPVHKTNETLQILKKRFPEVSLEFFAHDNLVNTDVLILPQTLPLVFSELNSVKVNSIKIKSREIIAEVDAKPSDTLLFSWLYNEHFQANDGSNSLKPSQAKDNKISIELKKTGLQTITLRYEPKELIRLFYFCYTLAFVILLLGVFWHVNKFKKTGK